MLTAARRGFLASRGCKASISNTATSAHPALNCTRLALHNSGDIMVSIPKRHNASWPLLQAAAQASW
jgi:hypothetical protein